MTQTEPTPGPATDRFVVPYRPERRPRARAVTAAVITSAVVSTVLGVAISAGMWWLVAQDTTTAYVVLAGLVTVTMITAVWFAWRPVRAALTRRVNLRRTSEALTISRDGVGFADPDYGGWIDIPWRGIEAARLASWRDLPFLHLALAPDLRADDPGVRGVQSSAAWRTLTRPTMGMVGPRFSLESLGRSIPEIDEALRTFSDGRITIS